MAETNNPITNLDYPDIDVIRVKDTYYMVSTTMYFMPGCEILQSYDLINWEHLTYVYDRLDSTPGQRLEGKQNCYGKGMWAASLRYHNGTFYICFVANDTGKTYLYTASNITGPWKKQLIDGFYHDASLLFDDERIYIVSGNKNIRLQELKADLSGPKENGLDRIIVSDEKNPRLGYEGSHLYKIDGRYYLFLIHSLADRWMRVESCFAADDLNGTFEGGDVLCDTMGYCNQGVAQGGIVDTPEGDWYAILFQDRAAVGRIPVLVPVHWQENVKVSCMAGPAEITERVIDKKFPVFGENGKIPKVVKVKSNRPDYEYLPLVQSDDFTQSSKNDKQKFGSFGLKSCWQFNHEPDLSLVEIDNKAGCFKITCDKICENITEAPNTITQRMTFPVCNASVEIDISRLKDGDYAGLCILQQCYGQIAAVKKDGQVHIEMISKEQEKLVKEEIICEDNKNTKVEFRLEADFSDQNDKARFLYRQNGEWKQIGSWHKMYFNLEHFTGNRIGLFAYSTKEKGGTAAFYNFRYNS